MNRKTRIRGLKLLELVSGTRHWSFVFRDRVDDHVAASRAWKSWKNQAQQSKGKVWNLFKLRFLTPPTLFLPLPDRSSPHLVVLSFILPTSSTSLVCFPLLPILLLSSLLSFTVLLCICWDMIIYDPILFVAFTCFVSCWRIILSIDLILDQFWHVWFTLKKYWELIMSLELILG